MLDQSPWFMTGGGKTDNASFYLQQTDDVILPRCSTQASWVQGLNIYYFCCRHHSTAFSYRSQKVPAQLVNCTDFFLCKQTKHNIKRKWKRKKRFNKFHTPFSTYSYAVFRLLAQEILLFKGTVLLKNYTNADL